MSKKHTSKLINQLRKKRKESKIDLAIHFSDILVILKIKQNQKQI